MEVGIETQQPIYLTTDAIFCTRCVHTLVGDCRLGISRVKGSIKFGKLPRAQITFLYAFNTSLLLSEAFL